MSHLDDQEQLTDWGSGLVGVWTGNDRWHRLSYGNYSEFEASSVLQLLRCGFDDGRNGRFLNQAPPSLPQDSSPIANGPGVHSRIEVMLCFEDYGQEMVVCTHNFAQSTLNTTKQLFSFLLLKKKTGREVRWSWLRVGILESIGNLGLNNFDSDDD